MLEDSEELRLRIAEDLEARASLNGGTLPAHVLDNYVIDSEPLRLRDVGRGIRNVREWDATLSITSYERGDYNDREIDSGIWRYPYELFLTGPRAGSIGPSNAKLERARVLRTSILMFVKPLDVDYIFLGLVRVTENDPVVREFTIALTPMAMEDQASNLSEPQQRLVREWAERTVRQRLHQPAFRTRVLRAYHTTCAVCRLRQEGLLDAAHIIADKDDWGDPEIPNGMALCKMHHAAYDRNYLGVTPDYLIQIRPSLLADKDGPMLTHGLQKMHGELLARPTELKHWPDPDRLDRRYREFLNA